LCEADDDVQDEQHADFHCTHPPIQCLFAGDMSPYSQRQQHRMFLHFCTTGRTKKLYFFYITGMFFMSRLAVARFDWRLFLVDFVCLLVSCIAKGAFFEPSRYLWCGLFYGWVPSPFPLFFSIAFFFVSGFFQASA
jgi:hypothetical protein